MRCPSFERLIDYIDGQLSKTDAETVESHLSEGCAHCTADRDWYNKLKATTAADNSTNPPPWVLRRAVRIFESHRGAPGLIERVGQAIASLVFDSFARPSLAGVRSTETASRQLLYRAGEFSIDLQVVPADRALVNLLGQVLREGELAFESVGRLELELIRDGKTIQSVATNELGEFLLSGIEPGVFDIRIRIPERTVTVPDLPIALP